MENGLRDFHLCQQNATNPTAVLQFAMEIHSYVAILSLAACVPYLIGGFSAIVLMPGWILASFPVAPKVIKNWTVGRHGNEARWNVCLLIIVLNENALHECDLINATRATLRS